MFLSRRVLTELGMLPAGFPNHTIKETAANTSSRTCGCPTRKMALAPPKWPTARIANREQLEKLLVEHYQSSTFKMCEHQQLPAMSGMPLRVQLKEGATPPTVANQPAEVPNTFKSKVKADLDREERLGVIERVPHNTPQTFCTRMLVVAKHNGEPRRVVNFKALNNI